MPKVGIISDVHGNYFALEEVLGFLQSEGCDQVVCLGDICGYYSMVNECIELLRGEGVQCIKGNHDAYILGESSCDRSKSVMDCIAYQKQVIAPSNLDWVASLGDSLLFGDCMGVHGGLDDFIDEYVTDLDFLSAQKLYPDVNIFLTGHTHIQRVRCDSGLTWCNPGSVGQPRDHDPRAACATVEDGRITLHRIYYPIDKTASAMAEAGFSDYYYRNLYRGCRIGEQEGDQ